jgi:hypothetical protein
MARATLAVALAVVSTCVGAQPQPPPPPVHMGAPDPPAPDTFTVSFATDNNGGAVAIECIREWAPLGVDRFYAALTDGFYDESALFRVVPGFVLQFGIAGTPEMNERWDTVIPNPQPRPHRDIRDGGAEHTHDAAIHQLCRQSQP